MTLAERPIPIPQFDGDQPLPVEVVDWAVQSPLHSAQTPPPRDTTVQPYDPERIRQQYEGQWFLVMQRWLAILLPFVSLVFSRWWDAKTNSARKNDDGCADVLFPYIRELRTRV